MKAIEELGNSAGLLAAENADYREAKRRKEVAENEVLKAIVAAALPALGAIASRTPYGSRGIAIAQSLYLGEDGVFFDASGELSVDEVLDAISLPTILALLLTAVRAQRGTLTPRTERIHKEAAILEGIAEAFRIGGVR